MLINIYKPYQIKGIQIIEDECKYQDEFKITKFNIKHIKGYTPAYVIYKINVESGFYYDIETILFSNTINSYNLSIYEENDESNKLSYNLDDLKRLFKFTFYPKKNLYIKILNIKKEESCELFKISFSKIKYINQLASADNVD